MRSILLAGVATLALSPTALLAQDPPNRTTRTPAPAAAKPSARSPTAAANEGGDPPAAPAAGSSTPAPPDPSTTPSTGPLDTLVEDASPAPAPAPAPTGNPVLDRLNALEAKVNALEARNRQLEEQLGEATTRVEKVEVRAAKSVQLAAPAPTFADVGDNFTFKPRGIFQIDYANYNQRAGGYDYNDGTDIRRARFGFDGTAFKTFRWRIEAEYVKNTVNLLDAYVQYTGIPKFVLTVGQHKAPYGLEANTSDAFNSFLERGMANNAFGAVGAERRVGISLGYATDKFTATVGVFGAGEAVQRNATTPDEVTSVNGRVTWEPILDTNRVLHVGASAYRATDLAAKTITLADRPNSRVDGGNVESVTLAPVTTGAAALQTPGVRAATFVGGEAAGVYGPFSVQGEYDHLHVDRYGAVPDLDFEGFYAFASVFLTGESRPFKGGAVDRLKPFRNFGDGDGFGAVELLARYDRLDLTDRGLSPLTRRATSWTGGVTWYLNPYLKVVGNYIRFKGLNSPLVVAPVTLNGTTAKGDVLQTRLQFDF